MTDILATKAAPIQAVFARLSSDLGPDRVVLSSETGEDPESIAVALRGDSSRVVFISTAGMEDGRYTVSYDQLHTKRSGDATIEPQTSVGVLYEGLHWITRKIFDYGVITGEFDSVPDRRKIRK